MVNPGVSENTGEWLVDSLLRMGVSDHSIGALTMSPRVGSVQALILRLLIFQREDGPQGPTPWQTIRDRTIARGWREQDEMMTQPVVSFPPERELGAGERWVLVPELPHEKLLGFAWRWFLDMAAICNVHIMHDVGFHLGEPPQIRRGSDFPHRWVVVNLRGDELDWEDGRNAGVEGLLAFAQHPRLLMDPFLVGGDLGCPYILKGLRIPTEADQPKKDWGCVELFPYKRGEKHNLEVRIRTGESARHHGRPSRHLTLI